MAKKIVPEKRICAVHDISCAGRCSLTVILPVVSVAGIECNVIPTAVLSTHTGEFSGYTFRDLSQDILPIGEHWKNLGREYDAIYSGFFGSKEQISMAMKLPEMVGREGCLLMVDPVMADAGKLYTGFDREYVEIMKEYVKMADVVVPNMTEASLLLGEEYDQGPHDLDKIKIMLEKLTNMGPKQAVITGVVSDDGKTGVASYDKSTGVFCVSMRKTVPGRYYGTGDLFASALLGAMLNGKSLEDSCNVALNLVHKSIERTHKLKSDVRYGVDFEMYLDKYAREARK